MKVKRKLMTPSEFEKIKTAGGLPPVLFLAGTEDYLIDQYSHRIIELAVPGDLRDFNLDVLYGPDTTAQRIVAIARSFPMLAEKRLVIVKDVNKMPASDLNALVTYTQKPNPSACLVLVARTGDIRQKALVTLAKDSANYLQCKPLYESQVMQWIEQRLRTLGYTIGRDAVSLLAMQVGTSLRDLANEIEKIVLFIGERKAITVADVADVAGFRKEYTIFSLQNAIGERKTVETLHIYRQLRSGMAAPAIIAQLARFFINLLIAKGVNAGPAGDAELAKITRIAAYFVRDLHKFNRNYSVKDLYNALENLRHVDYALKTYPVQESIVMEQLFVHILRGYPAQRLPFASWV